MAGDSREVMFGTIGFRGTRVPINTMDQGLPRIGSGQEIERSAQVGLTKIRHSSYDGGLISVTGTQPWAQVLTNYIQNDGLVTRIPRQLTLPYKLTAQATLDAVNHSGSVAANIRGHAANTSLGTTGLRFIYLIKNYVFTDTSLTDPAIVELTDVVWTDTVTAIEPNGVVGNAACFIACYNGATQDIRHFTDVTAITYAAGWTTTVALSADDYVNAIRYMPTLGPGVGVAIGTVATVNGVHFWEGTDTAPITLQTAVLSATKDIPGSIASTTMASVDLAVMGVDGAGATAAAGKFTVSGGAGTAVLAATERSGSIYFGNGAFSAAVGYAKGRRIIGTALTVAHTEGGLGDNYYPNQVIVQVGSSSSVSLSDGVELGTSGTDSYGGASITGGLSASTTDLDELTVELNYFAGATSTAGTLTASDVDVVITFANDGSTLAFPNGGWQTTPSGAFPHRIAMVHPERADKILITVPRKLAFIDCDWDSATERVIFDVSYPDTGMRYIHHAAPWQGGYAITGGNKAGPGRFLRHIDGSGNLRNLNMPRTNGGEWLCNSIEPAGSWLKLHMVKSDYTDFQVWLYSNGKYYPDTLKMSVGPAAIASQPIPFAEVASGLQQQQTYSFYPVSTTHLAALRQFLPEDLDISPLLINTAEVKSMAYTSNTTEDAFLKLIGPELDFGPEEALKTMTQGFLQSRLISAAAGAYGSVQSEWSIDGGSSYSSALTKEFTAFNTEYAVTGSGVAYDTLTHRIGLKHEAATAKTPNGANDLWTSVQQWSPYEYVDIRVDPSSIVPDVFSMTAAIATLQATKNVQPLRVGNKKWAGAAFEGAYYSLKIPPLGQPPTLEQHREINPKTGAAVDLDVIFRFRTTPGAA